MNTAAHTAGVTLPVGEHNLALLQNSRDLGEEITRLQGELERCSQLAGLKSDPTWPLVKALSTSLGVQWRLHNEGVQYFRDVSERLDRQLADTVAQAEKALETKRVAVIESLVPILSDLTVKNAKAWRRTLTIKTALTLGALVVVLALGMGMACYGAGWESGRVLSEKASGDLDAALQNAGPASELALASMVRANNLADAWEKCKNALTRDRDGRRVCAMPMWVDPRNQTNGGF